MKPRRAIEKALKELGVESSVIEYEGRNFLDGCHHWQVSGVYKGVRLYAGNCGDTSADAAQALIDDLRDDIEAWLVDDDLPNSAIDGLSTTNTTNETKGTP